MAEIIFIFHRRDVAPARPPEKAVRLSRLIQRLETLKLETEKRVAVLIAKPSNFQQRSDLTANVIE